MFTFNVPDMTCNHCEKVITKAIKALDSNAKIRFDIREKTVEVESSTNLQALQSAIENTGYSVKAGNKIHAESSCCGHCSV